MCFFGDARVSAIVFMIKSLLLLMVGCFGGLWIAWPGLTKKENLSCAYEIFEKTRKDRTDIRAVLAISPNYLIKKSSPNSLDKFRIIGDACFR
tara:strand:+ start:4688 stop:4966 length:279 start_codon:yes stop_codon:yes gene_type:complete